MQAKQIDFFTATEAELRDAKAPTIDSAKDLADFVTTMVERGHDYGTCCYAMSLCAEAAFNFVAHKLGVTGFQASCADMDFVRRTRGYKLGFRLVDYSKLLYPHYEDSFQMSMEGLLADPATRKALREEAGRLVAQKSDQANGVHPDVMAHWQMLASLPVLDGEAK